MTTSTTNRLANIATRQRSTLVRDALFALGVALAAALSIASVEKAADAATPAPAHVVVHVAQR